MHWVLNFKVHKNMHRDKKNAFQNAPNLHRDKKKQKLWTSKCTKPAQGQTGPHPGPKERWPNASSKLFSTNAAQKLSCYILYTHGPWSNKQATNKHARAPSETEVVLLWTVASTWYQDSGTGPEVLVFAEGWVSNQRACTWHNVIHKLAQFFGQSEPGHTTTLHVPFRKPK